MDSIKKYNNMSFRNMYKFLDWIYYIDPNFKWHLNKKYKLIVRSQEKEYAIEFTLSSDDPEYKYKTIINEINDEV